MVGVIASSEVDRGFEDRSGKIKRLCRLVFVVSTLSTQHLGERAQIGWLGFGKMCPSGATCLSAEGCFSELVLFTQIQRVGLVQSVDHHQLIEI